MYGFDKVLRLFQRNTGFLTDHSGRVHLAAIVEMRLHLSPRVLRQCMEVEAWGRVFLPFLLAFQEEVDDGRRDDGQDYGAGVDVHLYANQAAIGAQIADASKTIAPNIKASE